MKYTTVNKKLKCTECGDIFEIYRKAHRNRKIGHIKHMYCHICKKVTAHIELGEEEISGFQPIVKILRYTKDFNDINEEFFNNNINRSMV